MSIARLTGGSSLHACRPVTNTGNISFANDSQRSGRTLMKHLQLQSSLWATPLYTTSCRKNTASPGSRETMTCGSISCQSTENAVLGSESYAGILTLLLTSVSGSRTTVQASCRHRLRDAIRAYSEAWLNLQSLGDKTSARKLGMDGNRICMQGRICS
jgi:hypothetical protein